MTDDPKHRRSSQPVSLQQARRCGAKTRAGQPCRSPAVRDRPRCRMHGCGRGAGGPQGERNGNYRHGRHTKETKAVVGSLRRLIREGRELSRMLSPRDPDR
jgi:hypothetical protein